MDIAFRLDAQPGTLLAAADRQFTAVDAARPQGPAAALVEMECPLGGELQVAGRLHQAPATLLIPTPA